MREAAPRIVPRPLIAPSLVKWRFDFANLAPCLADYMMMKRANSPTRGALIGVALLSVAAHATVPSPAPAAGDLALPVSSPKMPGPKGGETLNAAARAQIDKGREALEAGDLNAAEEAFAQAAKAQPTAYSPRLGLADVALRRNRRSDAEQFMKEALVNGQSSSEVAAAAGRLAFALGQNAEGEKQLKRAIAIDPNFVTPLTDLGEIYLASGRVPEASKSFRNAIAASPEHPGARFGLGRALAAGGDMAGAATAFEDAARLSPGNPLPLIALAELQAKNRQFDQALASLDRAAKAQPANLRVGLVRADVLVLSGARDKAVAELSEMLKTAQPPGSAHVFLKLGILQQAAGQLDAAQNAYLRAVEADDKIPLAHNNLAWVAAERKRDLDLALKHVLRALDLQPAAPSYEDTLGFVHSARGEYDQAIEAYWRAIRSAPGVPDFHYRLALALQAQGQADKAAASFKAALDLGKPFADQQDAQARLKALSAKHQGSKP